MKKIAAVVLSMILAINCLGIFASAAENERVESYLNINELKSSDNVVAGEGFVLSFKLGTTTYGGTAKVTVSGDGFAIAGDYQNPDYTVNSADQLIQVPVKADETLFSGSYPLTVNVEYTAPDKDGFLQYRVSNSKTLYVKVEGGTYTPPAQEKELSVEITNVYVSGSTVAIGGSATLSYEISVSEAGGSAFASIESPNIIADGTYPEKPYDVNGLTASASLPIHCLSSASEGVEQVQLTVTYSVGGRTATTTKTVNVATVDTSFPEPEGDGAVELQITSAPTDPVMAGDTFQVGINATLNNVYFVNSYGFPVYQQATGTVSVEGEGFTLAGALGEQDIPTGRSNISILADPGLTKGRKQLAVTVKFKVGDKEYTASRTLNIDIDAEEKEELDESKDNASFSLVKASIPEGKGRSNLATKLSLEFKNNTNYEARNLKIKLTGLGDIILNTYTDTVEVGNVEGGGTAKAVFPIKFAEYPTQQPMLTFELVYEGAVGEVTESFNVYLQATEKKKEEEVPQEQATMKPKVIVASYSVEADNENNEVVSGEEFTLKFVLENTSSEKDLRNMTVKVTPGYNASSSTSGTSSGPVFSFIDGTSSFYTDVFEKSAKKEYSIRLKCSSTAGAGSYPIDIEFDFQYDLGNSYSDGNGSLSINLPVTQPIKFDLMEWYPPTECGPEGTMISFQYFNKSRNPMTALAITVEGDFSMPTQYVGSLAASSYDNFSGTITPNDPSAIGETKHAVLVFTFEDAAGTEQRIEEPFDVTIVEGTGMGDDLGMGGDWGGEMMYDPTLPEPGMEFDEFGNPVSSDSVSEGGLPLWAKIAIPAAAALVVIIAAVVVVKKVKAKRNADDEDED